MVLGPYVGAATDHTVIPLEGNLWTSCCVKRNFVVPDVWEQDNYLACSLETKAEIVVPIIKDGVNIGQIDIDSHKKTLLQMRMRITRMVVCGIGKDFIKFYK